MAAVAFLNWLQSFPFTLGGMRCKAIVRWNNPFPLKNPPCSHVEHYAYKYRPVGVLCKESDGWRGTDRETWELAGPYLNISYVTQKKSFTFWAIQARYFKQCCGRVAPFHVIAPNLPTKVPSVNTAEGWTRRMRVNWQCLCLVVSRISLCHGRCRWGKGEKRWAATWQEQAGSREGSFIF